MEKEQKVKKKRLNLNREIIAKTALEMCDRSGLDSLSFRKLAKELSCEAMSIYYYFPSKGHLLDAIADLIFSELIVPPKEDGDWMVRLKKFTYHYREIGQRHPKTFQLLTNRRANHQEAFKILNSFFEFLLEEGFLPLTVARIFRTVGHYINGAIMAEIAVTLTGNEPTPAVLEDKSQIENFPFLSEISPYLGPAYYDSNFEFGLNIILQELAKLKE